jgi:hypothetical protein
MKLLIDTPLMFVAKDEVGTTDQDRADSKEEWDETCAVLKKFGVAYALIYTPKSIVFVVKVQKIVLDDTNMNELLYDGLWVLDLDFRFAGLGGRGCETAFNVTQRV